MNRSTEFGDTIYFWWLIIAVFGATALMLYALMAFAMGGDETPIQIAFALSVVKLICLLVASAKALWRKRRYLVMILIASSIFPVCYFGQMIHEKSSPFGYAWGFADFMLVALLFVDLIEFFLTATRLIQLRTPEVTLWPH